jgi:1,4-alpha-glucan branching enzyme/maltooligosyltrehalose trehalohydrolase
MTMRALHSMPFGATLRPQGGALFRLWAPLDARIELVLQREHGEVVIAAMSDAQGWREALVPDAQASERYQWRVHGPDGLVAVPDPASRSNPQGVNAPCELIDPCTFEWDEDWQGRPWHEAVSYELHIGTFTEQGTFEAAQARLPVLAELGITCIQLMPLASFPGKFGWGYDGVLQFAPHAAYGPPEALKAFVQAAHRLGIMVMLDVVYNHFGPEGNYLPLYAPGFFTQRHHTPWGAAINFDGADAKPVRDFFIHNALYWLHEYQFDGLRLDAVHAMLDDSRPDILEELSRRVHAAFPERHVHLVLENDFNDGRRLSPDGAAGCYQAQWSGDFHHTLHVLLTGEREGYYAEYANSPLPMLARALTNGFTVEGAPHLCAEGTRQSQPRRAATRPVSLRCTLNFLQNHDQIGNRAFGERLTQLLPEEPLRLAIAILLLCPAPPLLFMGEEHGATTPFLYFANWTGALREAVSTGRRKEFARFPSFSDEVTRNRIPDPCDPQTMEKSRLDWASFDQPTARKWYQFYQVLIALRRKEIQPRLPTLAHGGHTSSLTSGRVLTVHWRFNANGDQPARDLEMMVNLGTTPQSLPEHEVGTPLFDIGMCRPGHLGPWSGRWRWIDLP